MAYILKGDRSGTVRFTPDLGTVTAEAATFSNKVTSSQVESGGSINDHAVNDPIKLNVGGITIGSSAADILVMMCKNKDLIEYQGKRRYSNMIITSLNISGSTDNKNGFTFTLQLQQIRFVTAQSVNIAVGNSVAAKSGFAASGSTVKNGGLVTTSNQTVSSSSYLKSVNAVVAKKNNNSISSTRKTQSDSGYAR